MGYKIHLKLHLGDKCWYHAGQCCAVPQLQSQTPGEDSYTAAFSGRCWLEVSVLLQDQVWCISMLTKRSKFLQFNLRKIKLPVNILPHTSVLDLLKISSELAGALDSKMTVWLLVLLPSVSSHTCELAAATTQ